MSDTETYSPHVVPLEKYGELGVDYAKWGQREIPDRLLIVWARECGECDGHGEWPNPTLLEPCGVCCGLEKVDGKEVRCSACVLPGYRSGWVDVGETLLAASVSVVTGYKQKYDAPQKAAVLDYLRGRLA